MLNLRSLNISLSFCFNFIMIVRITILFSFASSSSVRSIYESCCCEFSFLYRITKRHNSKRYFFSMIADRENCLPMYVTIFLCVRSKRPFGPTVQSIFAAWSFVPGLDCVRQTVFAFVSSLQPFFLISLLLLLVLSCPLRWLTGSSSSHTTSRPSQSLYDNHVLPVLFHWHIWHRTMLGVWIVAASVSSSAFASASNIHTNVVFALFGYLSITRSTCAESSTT